MNHPDQIFANGVSPSMVDKWICKRNWYNHYIRGWRSKESAFLFFGSAWDNFLNSWYAPKAPPKGPERDIAKLQEKFKLDMPVERNLETKYLNVTQAQGLKGIELYGQVYNPDTEPFKVLETQKRMSIDMKGLDVPLHIVLDGQMEYRDGLWVLENKSTSKNDMKQYLLDWQGIVYPLGLAKLTGRKVEGTFYNVFLTHKTTSEKSFQRDDVIGCKTQGQLEYGWKQFCFIANDLVQYVRKHWEDVEAFPQVRNKMICHRGNCIHRDVCEANDNARLWNGEVYRYERDKV